MSLDDTGGFIRSLKQFLLLNKLTLLMLILADFPTCPCNQRCSFANTVRVSNSRGRLSLHTHRCVQTSNWSIRLDENKRFFSANAPPANPNPANFSQNCHVQHCLTLLRCPFFFLLWSKCSYFQSFRGRGDGPGRPHPPRDALAETAATLKSLRGKLATSSTLTGNES